MTEDSTVGHTGGVVWGNRQEWDRRRSRDGCVICAAGEPKNVIATLPRCWATAALDAPLPHYVCVVAREHVVEPFELSPADQAGFWQDAMIVAEAVATVSRPMKMNYEIHGNTLPHLHMHLFPRAVDDPFVGGPIDPRRHSVRRDPAQIEALGAAIRSLHAGRGR